MNRHKFTIEIDCELTDLGKGWGTIGKPLGNDQTGACNVHLPYLYHLHTWLHHFIIRKHHHQNLRNHVKGDLQDPLFQKGENTMEYSYSKPTTAPSYQTAPPSRVSPVGASSFSGPKGGGGIFPFIPLPGTTPTGSPDATSSAGENAARNAAAQSQAQSMSAINASVGQIRQLNQAAQPQLQPQQNGLRIEASISQKGLNGINSRMAEQPKMPNSTVSTNSLDRLLGRETGGYGQKTDVVYGTHGSDFLYDAIIDRGGADQLPDRIISGSGADRFQDRIISGSGSDELRYRSFQDVEASLPSDSVSFRVSGQDPVLQSSGSMQKPLTTKGQMSFQNVQNLPVPDTSMYKPVQQSGPASFWDYAMRYQQDKMEHPLREIGLQTGASLLAAPLLAGMAPAAAVSSAVAPVANNIVRLVPQTSQAVQSAAQAVAPVASQGGNIVNFADYARKVGTLAAGVVGAVALPAAAQTMGWNPQTQTYSTNPVRGRQ